MSDLIRAQTWPESPYRGLNYYRLQDRALLAGRERDVADCSALLAHPETRVLLLHGMTGSGKSSFLRAGLIPTLEKEGAGYLFLRTSGTDDEALFIRSTDTPVDQIARQVYLFVNTPFSLRTPAGSQQLDLTLALLGAEEWEHYLAVAREENQMAESLRCIARTIPMTFVLIVDQAEEVLTLNPGEEGLENRARFFRFLREFHTLRFPARIIVAFRTEFYGRFIDALQITDRAAGEFKQFLLHDLQREDLVDAIERPSSKKPLDSFGTPYDYYHFSFEPGLAEKIANDIIEAKYSGAALPVLQLVCRGLYTDVVTEQHRSTIETRDYLSKSGIEGQIMAHVRSVIRSVYDNETSFDRDLGPIRKVLSSFYTMQDDGTVISITRPGSWVTAEFERALGTKTRANAEASITSRLITTLSLPHNMVLRPLKAVKGNGRIEEEFTLGHDSIALALDRWDTLDAAARQRREDKWNLIIGILFLISLVATIVYVPLAFLFDLTFRYLIYIWMPTVVFIYINLGYSFFRRVLERGLSFTFRPDLSPRKRRRA